MKKRIQLLLVLAFLLSFNPTYSQNSIYNWESELCSCESKFDSTKYSREQLDNTIKYLWWMPIIDANATAWKLEDIDKLSVEKLEEECELKLNRLRNLKFVDNTFWEEHRRNKIVYFESACELMKLTILGYSNPDTLKHYDNADDTTKYYLNALVAGGQEMLDAWFALHEIKKSKNGAPEKLEKKFLEQLNSSQPLDYARLELMKFGWWNCANHTLPHIDNSIDFFKEFKKLFIETECKCDEP